MQDAHNQLYNKKKMARPDGKSLNDLFSTLANWNACLAEFAPDNPRNEQASDTAGSVAF